MQFRVNVFVRKFAITACMAVFASALVAQNSIQLFGPVNVRLSATGTGYGTSAVNFNSSTLNLTCPEGPITAVLSSTTTGTGNLLVDNNINVTVTAGTTVTGPTNICVGGITATPSGFFQNCFGKGYEDAAGYGTVTGQNPDNFVAADGIAPIDISSGLQAGQVQVKIDLQDEGGYLTNSSLYLVTNCTQGGVTGPALISGNPISGTSPSTAQLNQDFTFNPVTNQAIGFEYNLADAQSAGTLAITDQTIPQVADSPLDPASFQPVIATGTSFATSICLVHSGELLPNGSGACKLFTLQCKVGTGATATGAQCPVSTVANEVIRDVFDGPSFVLSDIPTPGGATFHEGIGFLMASEGWSGGPCTFDPASGLQALPCPQNLLTSFTGPGLYTGSSRTTHPNSTFISIAQVPEDLTTVTVAGQLPGGWIHTPTASVTLSSQPPNLSGTTLPGAGGFVASPILSITYGISSSTTVPVPGNQIATDTSLPNSITCPTMGTPTGVPAGTFTPGVQTLTGLADGYYLLHYYAQDCAGTQELKFIQDGTGTWSTNFYTYAINVDTVAPAVASGPALSPAPSANGTYVLGQAVTASYSCTDSLSGVARCGGTTFSTPTNNTGNLTSTVDTSSLGMKTFTLVVVDAAGNQSSASVNYQVVSPYDSQIQLTLGQSTITYPRGTQLSIRVTPLPPPAPSASRRGTVGVGADCRGKGTYPTGTVQVLDGGTVLGSLRLENRGDAEYFLRNLGAGKHAISVIYSGDARNPAGTSAPITLTVLPGSVHITAECDNSTLRSGKDFRCGIFVGSGETGAQGVVTYSPDGAAAMSLTLSHGFAGFLIHQPALGSHSVDIGFAAQGSYLAAADVIENYNVVAH